MQIEVIAVRDCEGTTRVAFACAAGRGEGRWGSVRPAPSVGERLSVELDLDRVPDQAAERRSKVAPCVPSLERTDLGVVLTAAVERAEDDGVAVLRLSQDAIVLVETDFGWAAGDMVRLELAQDALRLTPSR
jgi:hypothetical protein